MCWICGRTISSNGLAWVGHQRVHVREGLIKEILDYDGRITFRKLPKQKSKRGERRMKATVKRKVILELDEKEATWLKNVMQNTLWGMEPNDESSQDREMRKNFFSSLDKYLMASKP